MTKMVPFGCPHLSNFEAKIANSHKMTKMGLLLSALLHRRFNLSISFSFTQRLEFKKKLNSSLSLIFLLLLLPPSYFLSKNIIFSMCRFEREGVVRRERDSRKVTQVRKRTWWREKWCNEETSQWWRRA